MTSSFWIESILWFKLFLKLLLRASANHDLKVGASYKRALTTKCKGMRFSFTNLVRNFVFIIVIFIMSADDKCRFLIFQIEKTKMKHKHVQINIKLMMNHVDESVKQHETQPCSQHSRQILSKLCDYLVSYLVMC